MFFRMIFGLPGAAAITALMFLAMGWLIRQDAEIGTPPPPVGSIIPKMEDSDATKPKPPRAEPILAPEPIDIEHAPPSDNPGPTIDIGVIPGPKIDGGVRIDPIGTQPTLRIAPSYPENCRARGAQGVVMVEFDVTAEGAVVNPRVIASENSCLDRAAMNTISRWKYTPKTDSSGRPVPQRGLRQTFNYQLTE
jgi:protein TonB